MLPISIIVILALAYGVWFMAVGTWEFFKYKRFEKKLIDNILVGLQITEKMDAMQNACDFAAYERRGGEEDNAQKGGMSDMEMINFALGAELNRILKEGTAPIRRETIMAIARRISELSRSMELRNVLEIYCTFIFRYVLLHGKRTVPKKVTDQQLLNALEKLEIESKNGYHYIKADAHDRTRYPW